jgi:cytochrome c5
VFKFKTKMKTSLPLLPLAFLLLGACAQEKKIDTKTQTESASKVLAEQKIAEAKTIYDTNCASCHDTGMMEAPKPGDTEEWNKRMAQGFDVVINKSIEGFEGKKGTMPAKGGNENLSESEITKAVSYMSGRLK